MNVHGVGELIYDHVFENVGEKLVYRKGGGGGSLGNFLANIASQNIGATFHTVIGGNEVGAFAELHAKALGVKEGFALIEEKKQTRIIFEIAKHASPELFNSKIFPAKEQHQFQTTCPICGSEELSSLARLTRANCEAILPKLDGADILYFDRIAPVRCELAKKFKSKTGGVVVMDLGRTSYLRYLSREDVVKLLKSVDILFAPPRVISTLVKRAEFPDEKKFFQHLGIRLVLSSNGSAGITASFLAKDGEEWRKAFPAPKIEDVKDEAGAGDAFLAYFLGSLATSGSKAAPFDNLGPARVEYSIQSALEKLPAVLSSLGARGHLDQSDGAWNYLKKWEGLSVNELKREMEGKECDFCFRKEKPTSESRRKVKKNTFTANVRSLLTRIAHRALNEDASERISEIVTQLNRCLIVGTGGSYPAAKFLEMVINRQSTSFARATRPLEYLREKKVSDSLIVVTYSGTTKDCEAVLKEATRLGVRDIYIVSGKADTELGSRFGGLGLRNVISYENGGPLEKGFVSIRGTVLPCALFTFSFVDHGRYRDMTTELTRELKGSEPESFISAATQFVKTLNGTDRFSRIIDVYGTGVAVPAMADIESKCVESGIAVIRLHESKDFSHGRFISVFQDSTTRKSGRTASVVLCTSDRSKYEEKLYRVLQEQGDVLLIDSKFDNELGALDLLIKVQYFVKLLALQSKVDASRPDYIAPKGLELYRWKVLK